MNRCGDVSEIANEVQLALNELADSIPIAVLIRVTVLLILIGLVILILGLIKIGLGGTSDQGEDGQGNGHK